MEKRTLQAIAIYIGAGWTGFGIISWLVSRYGLDPRLEEGVLWTMLVLTPAVGILASSRSWQERSLTTPSKRLLTLNVLVAMVVLFLVVRQGDSRNRAGSDTDSVEVADLAAPLEDAAPEPSNRRSVAVFTPKVNGETWRGVAFSLLTATSLEQDAALTVFQGLQYVDDVRRAGAQPDAAIALALQRRIAVKNKLDLFVSGALIDREGDSANSVVAELEVHSVDDTAAAAVECAGPDLLELADACAEALQPHLSPDPVSGQLPVAEITMNSETALEAFTRGLIALQANNDPESAETLLRAAVEADPTSALARYWLGSSLFSQNQQEQGVEQLRLARQSDYRLSQRSRFQLASDYLTLSGQPDEALAALENWTSLFPDSVEAQLRLADMLVLRSRLEEAGEAYRAVLRVQPDNLNTAMRLAGLHRRLGQFDQALAVTRSAREQHPENANVALMESQLHRDVGQLDQALMVAQRASSLSNQPIGALLTIADLHFRSGNFDEADATLDRALQTASLDQDKARVAEVRIQQHLFRGRFEVALKLLRDQTESPPYSQNKELFTDARTFFIEAQAFQDPALAADANELAERLNLLPERTTISPLAMLALGRSAIGQSAQSRELLTGIEKLIEKYGLEDWLRYIPHWAGHVNEDAGDFDSAAEHFRSALELDPANTELGMEVGRVLRKSGAHTEAVGVLEATLARFPSFPEGNLELALALEALGKTADALEAAEISARGSTGSDPDYHRALETRKLVTRLQR